ncbi:MAG TPA: hypothetical protein VLW85_14750 [Myxococcales bacterium]|nr:hypothetical protein [Myxococcales bacterium]
MKKFILVAALSAACAGAHVQRVTKASDYKAKDGTPTSSKGEAAPQGTMVCEEEVPLGSHIPRKVCHYEEDREEAKRQAQDWFESHPAQNTKPGG